MSVYQETPLVHGEEERCEENLTRQGHSGLFKII
jgi:hypothetical protein